MKRVFLCGAVVLLTFGAMHPAAGASNSSNATPPPVPASKPQPTMPSNLGCRDVQDCPCNPQACLRVAPVAAASQPTTLPPPSTNAEGRTSQGPDWEVLGFFVFMVLLVGAAVISAVLIYRNDGFLKRGRRMASTITADQRLHERIRRLEADNRQMRELLNALHRKIDVFQHVIDNLQRANPATPAEYHEPSLVSQGAAMPSRRTGGGGIVSAYNESLRTPQDVRAFMQARQLFGLGKS